MKKLLCSLVIMSSLFSVSVFADNYSCEYSSKFDKGTGLLQVQIDDEGLVHVEGNYKVENLDGGDKVDCINGESRQETKASYFKKWAVYDFSKSASENKDCTESSIRLSKDSSGEIDMKSVELINYNGDRHDSSGFQAIQFICKSVE